MFSLFLLVPVIYLLVTVSRQKRELEDIRRMLRDKADRPDVKERMESPVISPAETRPTESQQAEPKIVEKPAASAASPYVKYGEPAAKPIPSEPVPFSQPTAADSDSEHLETVIGRNILGVIASVLVFIGIVFLSVLVYDKITDPVKTALMYLVSGSITALGLFLHHKKRSVFTEILTGCGAGALFISILLTHVYFGYIGDLTAFSLLLVWIIAVLLLSRAITSTVLSVVAHVGMVVSLSFAYTLGLDDSRLLLLIGYQIASTAAILLGNRFCCKKTFLAGAFISLGMTLVSGGFMWGRFPNHTSLPNTLIIAAFLFQFVGATFLSALISAHLNKRDIDELGFYLHILNKLIWGVSLWLNCSMVVESYWLTSDHWRSVHTAAMVTLSVLILHAAVSMLAGAKLRFSKLLETSSVIFCAVAACVTLLVLQQSYGLYDFNLSWFSAVAVFMLASGYLTRNRAYRLTADFILALDALMMIFGQGYADLCQHGTVFAAFGYLAFYLAVIAFRWYKSSDNTRKNLNEAVRVISFLLTESSIISIMAGSQLMYSYEIALILLLALNILMYILKFDRPQAAGSYMRILSRINEVILFTVVGFSVAFGTSNTGVGEVLWVFILLLMLGLGFVRFSQLSNGGTNPVWEVWNGIKLTFIVLAAVARYTVWFDQAYLFSVICMLTALACNLLGFGMRVKSLRLYGLVLCILCVLKMVTFDVNAFNTYLRVIAFIGGGAICFAISAAYSYASKRLDTSE